MNSPVAIQFIYAIDSVEAEICALSLYERLNDDPAVPGLHIPVLFPVSGMELGAVPRLPPMDADRCLVVVLADDQMMAEAQRDQDPTHGWRKYVDGLYRACEADARLRFMPVQLTEHGWPLGPVSADLNALRAWVLPNAKERHSLIARRIENSLIRQLTQADGDSEAPPITIFLSHTKLDLDRDPRAVRDLLAYLTATQPEKTWYDAGDIEAGSRFAAAIEAGVKDAVLLSVVTDSYWSRAWCRREVLLAKRYGRPVVIVDAVSEGETRRFPYGGNTPVVRWHGDAPAVVDSLLRETLRHVAAQCFLEDQKGVNDYVVSVAPELATGVQAPRDRTILYPDPPLGPEELSLLAAAGIRAETPLERLVHSVSSVKIKPLVAISASEPEDLKNFGSRQPQFEAALLEISRYLLLGGYRLAYGGHLQQDGYTVRLADLLNDPLLEQLRGKKGNGQDLVCYLPWPVPASIPQRARLGSLIEMRRLPRPDGITEALDGAFVEEPRDFLATTSPARRFAWARGLTEMREKQTSEVTARIVIGGKVGSGRAPYRGVLAGVLEEALLSLDARQPVFLVAGFGGCARIIFDSLQGRARDELADDRLQDVPFTVELRDELQHRGLPWRSGAAIAKHLAGVGVNGLQNGLTPEENQELAMTINPLRIVTLIFRGLARWSATNRKSESMS